MDLSKYIAATLEVEGVRRTLWAESTRLRVNPKRLFSFGHLQTSGTKHKTVRVTQMINYRTYFHVLGVF
jgi:hypothetical protein